METSEWYQVFAVNEVRGYSPCYERWALGIASDAELLALIDELPYRKRQPNLVFGAARYLGVSPSAFDEFKDFVIARWPDIRDVAMSHSTQTNESGRCATLLPLLARFGDTPIALIEFGASAGLCLYPDRYSYRYDDQPVLDPADGRSPVVLPCTTSGAPPLPTSLPQMVHRAGVDLNPLDVADPDSMRWLESLVWPEQRNRLERLRNAAAIARLDPPHLVTGHLNDTLAELVDAAPKDIPVIVFGSAVLSYLGTADRERFQSVIRKLPCHWITNEGPGVLPVDPAAVPHPPDRRHFVTALDGVPAAYAGHHGQTLDWFPPRTPEGR
ncbi:DUF2332 domain-containing protein [Nocardia huaxiensis]|uniref:DUF2332 domain-containing protein n=1 Tax=Nocardia huaxiensis TaxID=2755382 RepID=UPI001E58E95F|nr:DUF2332 domain-containing protein [Nocardia huaxiensis]UFS96279.1 DUF2332 domain-containing protein [Nocardia huaxiensis]